MRKLPRRYRTQLRHSTRAYALRMRLAESEKLLRALFAGELDAVVVGGPHERRIYTLEAADQPYRMLVETMNEGAATLLADGTLLYTNHRMAELVGLPPEQLVGMSFNHLIAPAERQAFALLLAEGCRSACVGPSWIVRQDGQAVPVQLSLRALAHAMPRQVCAVVTDLTERVRGEDALRAALAEKTVLIKEVHHRVKNNLQIISSLLRLQVRAARGTAVEDILIDTQLRIRVMALIHEQLYSSQSLDELRAAHYIRTLAGRVLQSYGLPASRCDLSCRVDDALALGIDVAIPIGMIMTELLANSVKYAFPDGRPGSVWVQLHADADVLALTVGDNGVGLASEIDPFTSQSLGLQIVNILNLQLRGTMHISRNGGTVYSFRFPHGTRGAGAVHPEG